MRRWAGRYLASFGELWRAAEAEQFGLSIPLGLAVGWVGSVSTLAHYTTSLCHHSPTWRAASAPQLVSLLRSLSIQLPIEGANHQQQRYEARDRIFQALHVQGTDGDGGKSNQRSDLRVRREPQAGRKLCNERLSQCAAKTQVGEQDYDPDKEHSGHCHAVEQ